MYFQEPIKHEIDKPLPREIEFSAFFRRTTKVDMIFVTQKNFSYNLHVHMCQSNIFRSVLTIKNLIFHHNFSLGARISSNVRLGHIPIRSTRNVRENFIDLRFVSKYLTQSIHWYMLHKKAFYHSFHPVL